MAANKKSAARRGAYLILIDESGFLMSPLVRRTLAPRGKTPILRTPTAHREKVSLSAALSVSPKNGRLGLHWRCYPRAFVNSLRSAEFLRLLLRRLRGPAIVVWDGGSMHKGEPIRKVLRDHPRLTLERFPAYSPDLNPVEAVWNHLKYGSLSNYLPDSLKQLERSVEARLRRAKRSPDRLRSFFDVSELPFY